MSITKALIASNLMWRLLERLGAQGITFLVTIVLARLLEPEYFGQVALITVFITIMQVFVDSGLGSALIQKPDADDTDFSTVFYFNVGMCSLMYLLFFLSAPSIAKFYNDISMTSMIRVAGITLLISGVKNIQQAYVSRHLMFRKFFYATLGGTLFSGVVGIILAYMGAGVWAIIFQSLSNTFIDTLILWITVQWRPKKLFSAERFKSMFSFGSKLLISSLVNTGYVNLWQLIIGKKYTKSDLAFYNRGQGIPNLIIANVNASIGSVLFPVLSSEQKDPELLKKHLRLAIRISTYLIWPMLMILAAGARPLIKLLLTDKWLPAVPYMQVTCFVCGMMPIHTLNLQAINAMGRSDLFLKLEIVKKTLGLAALAVAMQYGVLAIALSLIFTDALNVFINAWPNRRLLGYTLREQIADMTPCFLLSIFMLSAISLVGSLHMAHFFTLLSQAAMGGIIYVSGSALIGLDGYTFISGIIGGLKHYLKERKVKRQIPGGKE